MRFTLTFGSIIDSPEILEARHLVSLLSQRPVIDYYRDRAPPYSSLFNAFYFTPWFSYSNNHYRIATTHLIEQARLYGDLVRML
jgi:hypothetical protein